MEVPVITNLRLDSTTCRTVDVFPTILADRGQRASQDVDGQIIV
jgi:hypothetical protein